MATNSVARDTFKSLHGGKTKRAKRNERDRKKEREIRFFFISGASFIIIKNIDRYKIELRLNVMRGGKVRLKGESQGEGDRE